MARSRSCRFALFLALAFPFPAPAEIVVRILSAPPEAFLYEPVFVLYAVENSGPEAIFVPSHGVFLESGPAGETPRYRNRTHGDAEPPRGVWLEQGERILHRTDEGIYWGTPGTYEVRATFRSDGVCVADTHDAERPRIKRLSHGRMPQDLYECWKGTITSDTARVRIALPTAPVDLAARDYLERSGSLPWRQTWRGGRSPFRDLKERYPDSHYTYAAGLRGEIHGRTGAAHLRNLMALQPSNPLHRDVLVQWARVVIVATRPCGGVRTWRPSSFSIEELAVKDEEREFLRQIQREEVDTCRRWGSLMAERRPVPEHLLAASRNALTIRIVKAPRAIAVYEPLFVLYEIENVSGRPLFVPFQRGPAHGPFLALAPIGQAPVPYYNGYIDPYSQLPVHGIWLEPGERRLLHENVGWEIDEPGEFRIEAVFQGRGRCRLGPLEKSPYPLQVYGSLSSEAPGGETSYECWAGEVRSPAVTVTVEWPRLPVDVAARAFLELQRLWPWPPTQYAKMPELYPALRSRFPGSRYTFAAGARFTFPRTAEIFDELARLQPENPQSSALRVEWAQRLLFESRSCSRSKPAVPPGFSASSLKLSPDQLRFLRQVQEDAEKQCMLTRKLEKRRNQR